MNSDDSLARAPGKAQLKGKSPVYLSDSNGEEEYGFSFVNEMINYPFLYPVVPVHLRKRAGEPSRPCILRKRLIWLDIARFPLKHSHSFIITEWKPLLKSILRIITKVSDENEFLSKRCWRGPKYPFFLMEGKSLFSRTRCLRLYSFLTRINTRMPWDASNWFSEPWEIDRVVSILRKIFNSWYKLVLVRHLFKMRFLFRLSRFVLARSWNLVDVVAIDE